MLWSPGSRQNWTLRARYRVQVHGVVVLCGWVHRLVDRALRCGVVPLNMLLYRRDASSCFAHVIRPG